MSSTPPRRRWNPRSRDAALRRTRHVTGLIAAAAAGGAGLFSVVAAHAFKGHPRVQAAPARARAATVPGPEFVPSLSGAPRAPAAAPAPPPPAPEPEPVTSGGS